MKPRVEKAYPLWSIPLKSSLPVLPTRSFPRKISKLKDQLPKGTPQSFFFFLTTSRGIWDLGSPRIEPAPPPLEGQSLNHWTSREVPGPTFAKIQTSQGCLFPKKRVPQWSDFRCGDALIWASLEIGGLGDGLGLWDFGVHSCLEKRTLPENTPGTPLQVPLALLQLARESPSPICPGFPRFPCPTGLCEDKLSEGGAGAVGRQGGTGVQAGRAAVVASDLPTWQLGLDSALRHLSSRLN